ncbi:hypothetical protein BX616_003566 [Lobosporangium transversale]|uniref:Uncharacterized protein n=1 Tax=Lobosporangium transversale TaxID=64571 RepID=A0A1Y2GDV2_9FUNG|nr:hypothetical protein BCR41DRAFT_362167 [Lobosporangium transversale]KAF9898828.1 hypothetical protein BX616_003566 [Lobosporangium transversale]ORZ04999.1 hypothetical protein BCR41DRAFT_362167 [Lobosporangium transversale]|eukprot:XP_021876863.1 hypothetical protein BCR41DRAFT_362167 [Lobosporangium transversale]
MGAHTISTHTVKDGVTTTILTRTTTIVSEHEEILEGHEDESHGIVENVRRTFRDYWFPAHTEDDDDTEEDHEIHHDPSLLKHNSVLKRAYDYWKSLTQDADEAAKQAVLEARKARDEAAAEAKWAFLGYKKEAREAYEAAEKKYREALANAERIHEEAHEKAKSKWFQALDTTEREVGNIKDQAADITHQKWDRFKSAVNSLAYNPPKYGCAPSSQYWFSRHEPSAWDCREVWEHPNRHDHRHQSIKALPKKQLTKDKVHDTLTGLFHQAESKIQNAPSLTSFDSILKPVKDQYHNLLDRVLRNEHGAIEELDEFFDKTKAKLNEAKYYEEQTDSWLTSQWNSIVDNAGDFKDQYEHAFKNTIKSIKNARAEIYNSLINNLQRSLTVARNNIHEAYQATKDQADKSRLRKAIHDATESFSQTVKETETKIKSAPKNAYHHAIEAFNRDTAHLKAKLEHAAHIASKSASSASHHVSKSGSSVIHHASKSGASLSAQASKSAESVSGHASKSVSSAINQATDDAKSVIDEVQRSASNKYYAASDKARHGYEHATASASSIWSSATPIASSKFHQAQDQYYKLVGNVRGHWFDQNDRGEMSASSVYGAVLSLYFIFLAQRIWRSRRLTRLADPSRTTVTVVTTESEKHNLQNGDHVARIEKFKSKPSAEDLFETERNLFGNVLTQFTSVVPVSLILLILLELGGFSRVALHTLFVGLVTSQVLQGGLLNDVLVQLGVVDGVHTSGRELGTIMSWTVLGLAAVANAIKAIHD